MNDDQLDTRAAVRAYLGGQSDPAGEAQRSYASNVGNNPEYEAELRRVAQQTGVPVDSARAFPDEVKRKALVNAVDFGAMAEKFPSTVRFMADQRNAAVAHDDLPALQETEGAIRPDDRSFLEGIWQPVARGWAGTKAGLNMAIGDALTPPGLTAKRRMAAEQAGLTYTPEIEQAVRQAQLERQAQKYPVPEAIQQGMQEIGGAQTMGYALEAALSNPRATVETALQSLGASAPGLLMAAGGSALGPGGTAAGAGVGSFAVEYSNTVRDVLTESGIDMLNPQDIAKGMSDPELMAAAKEKAIKRGVPVAAFDALTAGVAGRLLAGAKGTGSMVARAAGETAIQAGGGAAGEAVAQAATGEYKPGDIIMEALAEIPSAFVEVPGNFREMKAKAQRGEQQAAYLERIAQTTQASKLAQRDADTFEQFVAQASEDGPVQDVYIDAKALMQSGMAEQLAQVSPAVAEQLPAAAATGGTVRIPVAEYAARIAPTELNQTLMDHLRTAPDGFSKVEAQEFMQSEAEQLQIEMERTVKQEEGNAAFRAGADEVAGKVQAQLEQTGRFSPEVNAAYAKLMGNFFAVQGAKMGVSPTELFDQTGFNVASSVGEGPQLEQGQSLKDVTRALKEQGLSVGAFEKDGAINLSKIVVPEGERGTGKGTEAMQALVDYADRTGQRIELTPSADFGGNKARLTEFYKRFGFVENKGKNKDHAISETMYRPAQEQKTLQQSDAGQAEAARARILRRRAEKAPEDRKTAMLAEADQLEATAMEKQTAAAEYARTQPAGGEGAVREVGTTHRAPNKATGVPLAQADIPEGNAAEGGMRKAEAESRAAWEAIKQNPDAEVIVYRAAPKGSTLRAGDWVSLSPTYADLHGEATQGAGNYDIVSEQVPAGDLYTDGNDINEVGYAPAGTLAQKTRGTFNPETNVITLLKSADLSTFLHEAGHFFLEQQLTLASKLSASGAALTPLQQELVKDTQALLDWFGVKDLETWYSMDFEEQRGFHEQFARGFESYLFEGKAPSIELQSLFQRFSAWLKRVYRELKALNVELTPEVREAMDRMLASNEQIAMAEQARNMMPLFETAEQAGLSEEEFAKYQARDVQTSADAIQDLQARGLRDMQYIQNARGREIKRLQKESAAARAEARMEVANQVMAAPVYQAWQFLTGKSKDETTAGEYGKLDLEALRETADPAVFESIKRARMTSSKGGIHPDLVAERFGFSSGDEMTRALAEATPPKEEIDAITDRVMLERHGELASPEAIEREADKAIHNDVRGRMLSTEANALSKMTGKPKMLAKAARALADAVIGRLKVRDIRPGTYAGAEARAGKAAETAFRKGDTETAASEKRNQVLNFHLTRRAYDAQDEVAKGLRYLRKFEKDGSRKAVDSDYLDQIDALLERFDLKTKSNKAIDKRKSLLEWVEAQREAGIEPDIPAELLNEARRESYRNMSLDDFRGLVDTVKTIEHVGRLKNKLLTAKDQKEFNAAVDDLTASIDANARGRRADTRTPTDNMGRAMEKLRNFWTSHIKAASWARIMDGGKDGGQMWERFIRPANERADFEATRRAEATQQLSEILAPLMKMGPMGGKGQFVPEVGRSFNREARLAIALNTGNESNLQRLMGGEGWNMQQVQAVLRSLTPEEWQAVQKIWDHFESYRPEIGAKEKRVYGKEPAWVEAGSPMIDAINSKTGLNLRGGYYPIKYDPKASQRAEEHSSAEDAKRQMQGAYTSATTRRSFTKQRAEEVKGRPLLYTLSGMYQGVNDVIHDLAWHEWLIDANRLLRNQKVDQSIRNQYGPEVKQQFKSWVQDIAGGDQKANSAGDQALSYLRQSVSIAGLGFNVVSAAMQPLGITQSIVRVGAPWIARGVAEYSRNPIAAAREVNEKSEFMRNRSRTRFRELNELRNQVQDQSAVKQALQNNAYRLMMLFQSMVDVPTWMGAYSKAIASGEGEARAVDLADQAVIDAQGGGELKDQSAIERGGPGLKLFTVFYSFMNTAMNLGVQQGMTRSSAAKFAADFLMLYTVPAVLGYFLKEALVPGGGDDDDPEELAKALIGAQVDYLFGLMVGVREIAGAAKMVAGVSEFGPQGYPGPAGTRMLSDIYKLAGQAQQGEMDLPAAKATINLAGDMLGLPSAQINRSLTGAVALAEGETENPAALLMGYQRE